MSQHTKRLRERPPGQGVGRKPLVKHADRRFQRGVVQVRVKTLQIRGHDEAFVRHHPVRQAADVEILIVGQRHFGLPTGGVELAEAVLVVNTIGIDKHLLNSGQLVQRDLATHTLIDWYCPPAKNGQPLCLKRALHGFAGKLLQGVITA